MYATTHFLFIRQQNLLKNVLSRIASISKYFDSEMSTTFLLQKRNLYCKQKYDRKVEELVNKQIQNEQQAAQDYLSIAVSFLHPSISRPGTGGFFMRMYKEEVEHMQDFIHYQLKRGGTPLIIDIKAPTLHESLTLFDAFKLALNMENGITEHLETLVSVAESVKDYQCADFVTSFFLTEQISSASEMAHHVTKLSRLGNNEHALFHYDLHLTKCYPYSHKTPGFK